MRKRVLVCGASGFIGRNIFETLSKNSHLNVYGTYFRNKFSDDLQLIEVDLRKSKNVNEVTRGMDIVIHAAAVSGGLGVIRANPTQYISDNIVMNTLIADASRRNGVAHLLFVGSSVVYPSNPFPQKEEDANLSLIHPQYFMGARIKTYMEDLCQFYSKFGDIRFTMIRPSNIYGPYDKFDLQRGHVFAATVKKVLSTKDGDEIVIWGEGKEKRDLLCVSDLVNFIETVIFFEPLLESRYNIFNVSSGAAISVSDLVKKIIKISGKNIGVSYDPSKPSLGNQIALDWQKAYMIFGWRPKVDLDQGIRQTIDWYLKNNTEENQNGK